MVSRFTDILQVAYYALHKISGIYCLTVCILKYLPSFVCLLALEYCCSFHFFATYISSFDQHGVHLPSFKTFKSFLTPPFSIQCVPIISGMYLFRLNAVIGSFLKISLKFSFICTIFQFFRMFFIIFGKIGYIKLKEVFCLTFFRVSFSVLWSILLSRLILSRCSLINDGW